MALEKIVTVKQKLDSVISRQSCFNGQVAGEGGA